MNTTHTTLEQAQQHYKIAEKYCDDNKWKESIQEFERAKVLFEVNKDWVHYFDCCCCIAYMLTNQSALSKAQEVLQTAIDYAIKIGLENTEIIADLYLKMATLHADKGDFHQSLHYHSIIEAIYATKPKKEHRILGLSYISMGVYFIIKEDYDKSFQYTQKALEIFSQWEDKELSVIATCYQQFSKFYKLRK